MPTPMVSPRGWSARPLSAEEWAEAERVAERLGTEVGRLIGLLPEHARSASGMARHLNVLRATCQRVVQAMQGRRDEPFMLTRLPGVEGLRQFLEGCRGAGVDESDVEAAESAVEALERLITRTGGSQAKLIERLSITPSGRASDSAMLGTLEQRETLFRAAADVTGRSCETSLAVYAFRPDPHDPATLQRGLCKGLIGSVLMPGGLPMILSSGDTLASDPRARDVAALPNDATPGAAGAALRGRTPEAILKPFTSDPLPMVTSRNRKGTLYQVVDPTGEGADRAIDVVTALSATHPMFDPRTGAPTLDAVWSLVTCPSARLILDVYLHADMERLYRPSIDALLWSATLDVAADDRWVMRLPASAQPRLQLLGRGLGHAHSDLYPRHAELTRYFFDHIGWGAGSDAGDFVGFRCEVAYPVWRAGYCMGFEYLGEPAARA